MNYKADINGIITDAVYTDESIRDIFIPLLFRFEKLKKEKGKRILVMLSAPPGAGKSTLCSFLEYLAKENGIEGITVIGMDGFHHYQDYLLNHKTLRDEKEICMVDIKGAPITFDLVKFKKRVKEVSEGKDVGWPVYDRMTHNPKEDIIKVTGDIVLLEGNYLLLKDEGWNELSDYADYTIKIEADIEDLRKRLVERKFASNHDYEKAKEFVERSDLYNARTVLQNSKDADLVLKLNKDNSYALIKGDI